MPIDRNVLDAVLDMDEHELRRLVILATARLERQGVAMGRAGLDVKLRRQHVRCGKSNCKKCPHGPYWYAYWWEGGRRRSRYVGKLEKDAGAAASTTERGVSGATALPSVGDG